MTDEKSETTASDRIDSYRRAILQTVAAGSMAGVAGLGGAQETTTEGDGEATTPDGETTTQDLSLIHI